MIFLIFQTTHCKNTFAIAAVPDQLSLPKNILFR